ncbi:MAG: hypothetical protein KGL39_39400 [Patescibacteria group bacterium]|nr:hypothetical protein [Patescibacteria group bacterium]
MPNRKMQWGKIKGWKQPDYASIRPEGKPSVVGAALRETPPETEKECRRCHIKFMTRSRVSKRCPTCQQIVAALKNKKSAVKLAEKRRKARELRDVQ